MAKPVVLKDVLEAIDISSDQMRAYVDPETGNIVTITDEVADLLEEPTLPRFVPQWQRDAISALQAIDRDRLLPLPDQRDIHEWEIMEDFARRQIEEHREQLLDALHGAGAFRNFKRVTSDLNLREAWLSYRRDALERIVRNWLERHQLQWT
jgi:hypothetical protein